MRFYGCFECFTVSKTIYFRPIGLGDQIYQVRFAYQRYVYIYIVQVEKSCEFQKRRIFKHQTLNTRERSHGIVVRVLLTYTQAQAQAQAHTPAIRI